MYPETKTGVAGAHASNKLQGNSNNASEENSFAISTAEKTNQSKRTIEQNIQIATELEEYTENEVRKDFTHSGRVAIAKAIEDEVGERRGRPSEKNVQNFAQNKGEKTVEVAAKKAGFGNKETYRQAKKVVEEGTPELVNALDENRIKPSQRAMIAARLANLY